MKKIPLTHDGFHGASDKESIVRAWWKGNPDAGVGIRIPDDFVVLDIDGRKGLDYLNAEELAVPATLTALTGNDGYHFWYRLPEGVRASRRIGILPKVDLLVNGYVVGPPSIHPNGNKYEWKTGEFNPSEISDAPDWIISTITSSNLYEKDKVDPDEILVGIAEGNRDNYLWRYACYLRGQRNLTIKEAIVLIEYAAKQCDPPFDLGLAKGMVERAWKYAKREDVKFKPKIYKPANLAAAGIPPPKFLMWHKNERGRKDGFIVPGLTLVTSVSKAGKSNLVAYIVAHIAAGKKLWNYYDVDQTGVLYIDLEQSDGFATQRLEDMMDGDIPMALDAVHDWPRMDNGGLEAIKETILLNPHIGVVVIDLLGLFWPSEVKMEGNAYQKEYFVLGQLKKFANDLGICLIAVHHNNKSGGKDQLMSISGTMAMSGVVDALFNLSREQGDVIGTLKVTGKNMPAKTLTLGYHSNNFKWTMMEIE